MWPSLEIGPWSVPAYGLFVLLGFAVAYGVRRSEIRRLGYDHHPGHVWVGVGGLIGAVVGSKLGLVLFEPLSELGRVLWSALSFDFTGKTVIGGIAGGYAGVEVAKRWVGIRWSTGDAYALALPLGQAIGRLGCVFHGCCYGTPWNGPWSVYVHDQWRHPTPLYEVGLDFVLAGLVFALRDRVGPAGQLFRLYLIGYAAIRFALDPLRADGAVLWGPLSGVQWATLLAMTTFTPIFAWHAWRRSGNVSP